MKKFRVGAISIEDLEIDLDNYKTKIEDHLEKMKKNHIDIVLLPSRTGHIFAGMDLIKEGSLPVPETKLKEWEKWHKSIAKKYRIFMIPGTVNKKEREGVFRQSILISPQGQLEGEQKQLSCKEDEKIALGEDIFVFSCTGIKIGLALEDDIYCPELARILGSLDVELVLAPVFSKISFPDWKEKLKGLWREAQQNQFWGVEAFFGPNPGGIYAPCEATTDRTGIIEQGVEGIWFELDYSQMERARTRFPVLKQLNPALVSRYRSNLKGENRQC